MSVDVVWSENIHQLKCLLLPIEVWSVIAVGQGMALILSRK